MTRVRFAQIRTLDVLPVDWMEDANCQDTDLGLWFVVEREESYPGEKRRRERQALSVCHRCDVRDRCLDWALEVDDRWAILGGTTPEDRAKIRRRIAKKAQRAKAREAL
jgi:WhiB family redox-sensing transcriptional regulator